MAKREYPKEYYDIKIIIDKALWLNKDESVNHVSLNFHDKRALEEDLEMYLGPLVIHQFRDCERRAEEMNE